MLILHKLIYSIPLGEERNRILSHATLGGQGMDSSVQESQQAIREEVRKLCQAFPDSYWQEVDKKELYPQEFVDRLTTSGYLAALIPEEYGGAGLGITEAASTWKKLTEQAAISQPAKLRRIRWA